MSLTRSTTYWPGASSASRATRRAPGRDGERAAIRHGVARVDGEVEHGHFELRRVRQHADAGRVEVELDRDHRPERAGEQVAHALDEIGDEDRLRFDALGAGEGEQLAGEPRAALGGLQPGFGPAAHPVRLVGLAPDQVEAAGDALQQVVEIVRDAAGELAHGFHLLRLAQRVLRGRELRVARLLRRDVAAIGIDDLALDGAVPGDPARRAVLVRGAVLEAREMPARRGVGERGPGRGRVLRPDELVEAAADHLLGPVPEDLLPGRVDGAQDAVGADHHQQVARVAPHAVALGGALRHLRARGSR